MKRIFLSAIAALAIGHSSFAQDFGFSKGSKLAEGSLYFNKTKGEEDYRALNFTTNLGYFLTDKIAIGPTVKVVNYHGVIDETPEVKVFGAGLFGRYYFLELGKRFKTFAEVQSFYENIRVTTMENDVLVKEPLFQGANLTAGVGANYFITSKIALTLNLSNILYFNTGKQQGEDYNKETALDISLNQHYNEFASSYFGLTFKF